MAARLPHRRLALALTGLLTLAASAGGCSGLATLEAGYQQPLSSEDAPGHRGLAVEAHEGIGPGDVPAGGGLMARAKLGSHQGQLAAGVEAFAFTEPWYVGAFGRVGVNVLQVETWSGHFAFGMGSPWVDLGFYANLWGDAPEVLRSHGGYIVTLKASVGYDVRFTSEVPNTFGMAVMLGFGFVTLVGI